LILIVASQVTPAIFPPSEVSIVALDDIAATVCADAGINRQAQHSNLFEYLILDFLMLTILAEAFP